MTPTIFGVTITRGLSTTEQAVIDCALQGMMAKESADHIGCSVKAVDQALEKMRKDFGAKLTPQLVAAVSVLQLGGMMPEPKRNPTRYGPKPKQQPRFQKVSSVWGLAS